MCEAQFFRGEVTHDYLTQAAEAFGQFKRHSYDHLEVRSNSILLDFGCGPGVDVFALAAMVDEPGHVVGYDHDLAMIKQAEANPKHNLGKSHFIHGHGDALPFGNDYFDGCRSERVFMHLRQPERTLAEMVRITKPGGRIVVIDTDWCSLSIDTPFPEIERALSDYRLKRVINNPYSGRSLYRQFKQCGLAAVRAEIHPVCTRDRDFFYFVSMQQTIEDQALAEGWIAAEQLRGWRDAIQQAVDTGVFYASANMIMLSAIKPFAHDSIVKA